MSWWMRRRTGRDLRRLGHRPRWEEKRGLLAVVGCRECAWRWGGTALRAANWPEALHAAGPCYGRRHRR